MSKAHAEIMAAMADSHSADMAVMNARIAGMTTIPPAGVATGRVGAAVGFHPGLHGPPPSFTPESIEVMAERARARVALVNLKNILKPPSKQAAPEGSAVPIRIGHKLMGTDCLYSHRCALYELQRLEGRALDRMKISPSLSLIVMVTWL